MVMKHACVIFVFLYNHNFSSFVVEGFDFKELISRLLKLENAIKGFHDIFTKSGQIYNHVLQYCFPILFREMTMFCVNHSYKNVI